MTVEAKIDVKVPDPKILSILLNVLNPETRTQPSERTKVKLTRGSGNKIQFQVNAEDRTALLACLNSFLRWTDTILKCYRILHLNNL